MTIGMRELTDTDRLDWIEMHLRKEPGMDDVDLRQKIDLEISGAGASDSEQLEAWANFAKGACLMMKRD